MLRTVFNFFKNLPFGLIAGIMAVGGILSILVTLFYYDVLFDYTVRVVLVGSILLGMVTAILGCFVISRRQSLVGDVLAHAALPGIVIGFLIGGSNLSVLLVGAAVSGWIGLQVVNIILDTTRLKQDTALGIVLATFFGLGISLLSYSQSREDAGRVGLDQFFFGQAATILGSDVLLIFGLMIVVLVIILAFWKEFQLTTFDAEFAMTNGFRVWAYNLLLSSLVAITVVMGLQVAGFVLMVGMLVAPAVAARQWTNNFGEMVVLASIFGAVAGGLGAMFSAIGQGRPTGPMIIGLASVITFGSIAFAPARGLIWQWLQQWLNRHRFERENLLGDLYQFAIDHGQKDYAVTGRLLVELRGRFAYLGLRDLQRKGLVTSHAGSKWTLTAEGYAQAENDYQRKLYWEVYQQHYQELPEVEIDYSKDVRDLLPSDAVSFLLAKVN